MVGPRPREGRLCDLPSVCSTVRDALTTAEYYSLAVEQATPSVLASYTSSWKPTICRTSYEHTSYAWKGTHHCSTNTYRRYGPHPTTAIAAAIRQAYWRLVRANQCTSMSSKQRPRMNGTGRANRRHKMLAARCVSTLSNGLMVLIESSSQLPEYFL